MEPYKPMAVAPATALSLLKAHPPHRDLVSFHTGLMSAMETELHTKPTADLAGRLRDWFGIQTDPDQTALPASPSPKPSPRHNGAKGALSWQMEAAISAELPELTPSQLSAARDVVLLAVKEHSDPCLERVIERFTQAAELHQRVDQGTLTRADVRLCLALFRVSTHPQEDQQQAFFDWKGNSNRGPTELKALAHSLPAAVDSWSALRWRLLELASQAKEFAATQTVPPGSVAPTAPRENAP